MATTYINTFPGIMSQWFFFDLLDHWEKEITVFKDIIRTVVIITAITSTIEATNFQLSVCQLSC